MEMYTLQSVNVPGDPTSALKKKKKPSSHAQWLNKLLYSTVYLKTLNRNDATARSPRWQNCLVSLGGRDTYNLSPIHKLRI